MKGASQEMPGGGYLSESPGTSHQPLSGFNPILLQ